MSDFLDVAARGQRGPDRPQRRVEMEPEPRWTAETLPNAVWTDVPANPTGRFEMASSRRGGCPVCGGEFMLTKAGTMRYHRDATRRSSGWPYTAPDCEGYGQPPKSIADDPIAAAEKRGYEQAIAALRDDDRFLQWQISQLALEPRHLTGRVGRDMCAAYLEAGQPTPEEPSTDA